LDAQPGNDGQRPDRRTALLAVEVLVAWVDARSETAGELLQRMADRERLSL
jgi:hypothetical protein